MGSGGQQYSLPGSPRKSDMGGAGARLVRQWEATTGLSAKVLPVLALCITLAVFTNWRQLSSVHPVIAALPPPAAPAALLPPAAANTSRPQAASSSSGSGPQAVGSFSRINGAGASGSTGGGGGPAGAGGACPPTDAGPGSERQVEMSEDYIPPGCLHLRDTCADQQSLVLMGPIYRPDAAQPRPLPVFHPPHSKFNYPWYSSSNPDALATMELQLPPVAFRATSSNEPTEDLRHPVFDSSVVPVIFYPTWQENFGHTLGNNMGWLHTHLRQSNASWADRAKLVLATPHGLAVPSHWHTLYKFISDRPVESYADFSDRLPPGTDPATSCRRRCYRNLLLCSGDEQNTATNVWQTGQAIVEHFRPQLPPSPVEFLPPTANLAPAAEPRNGSSSSSSSNSSSSAGGVKVLRVVFLDRHGPSIRRMTNLPELLEACRAWSHTVPATGQRFAASCAAHASSDLLTSIAVAQSADVLVSIHGASTMNSIFMRPGSAVLEIFYPAWPWHVHAIWLDRDPKSRLQWWGLVVNDPSVYTPGDLELKMPFHPGLYPPGAGPFKMQRDRNIKVPWVGVDRLLQDAVAAWDNRTAYDAAHAVGCRRYIYTPPGNFTCSGNDTMEPTLLGDEAVVYHRVVGM